MSKEKKTMDLRDAQENQEVGGNEFTFQELDDHARSS